MGIILLLSLNQNSELDRDRCTEFLCHNLINLHTAQIKKKGKRSLDEKVIETLLCHRLSKFY